MEEYHSAVSVKVQTLTTELGAAEDDLAVLKRDLDGVFVSPTIKQIEKEEQMKKAINALRVDLGSFTFKREVAGASLKYVGKAKPPTTANAVAQVSIEYSQTSLRVPLPVLRKHAPAWVFVMGHDKASLPANVKEYLLEQFPKRRAAGKALTVCAPREAVSEDGKLMPLPEDIESELISWSKKTGSGKPRQEHLAWQWLIVSHNQGLPKARRVRLARELRRHQDDHYSKTAIQARTRKLDQVETLKQQLGELTAIVSQFVNRSTPLTKDEKSVATSLVGHIEGINELYDEESKAPYVSDAEQSSGEESLHLDNQDDEEDWNPPNTVEFNGKTYTYAPPDWHHDVEGHLVQVITFKHKGRWGVYVSPSTDDVPIKFDEKTNRIIRCPFPAKPDSQVLKEIKEGEAKAKPSTATSKAKSSPKQSVARKKAQPEAKSQAEVGVLLSEVKTSTPVTEPKAPAEEGTKSVRGASPSADSRSGPLRVNGAPRTADLSEEEISALRAYVQRDVPEITGEEWESLSTKEKSKYRKSRSIPRWMLMAVKTNRRNLDKILKGKLTIKNSKEIQLAASSLKAKKAKGKPEPNKTSRSRSRGRSKSRGPRNRGRSRDSRGRGGRGAESSDDISKMLKMMALKMVADM
jgi:hypothetical protein